MAILKKFLKLSYIVLLCSSSYHGFSGDDEKLGCKARFEDSDVTEENDMFHYEQAISNWRHLGKIFEDEQVKNASSIPQLLKTLSGFESQQIEEYLESNPALIGVFERMTFNGVEPVLSQPDFDLVIALSG